MKYNKADLNHAISEAHLALEEVDNFDLDSKDPASVAEFDKLNEEHNAAFKMVIKIAKTLD